MAKARANLFGVKLSVAAVQVAGLVVITLSFAVLLLPHRSKTVSGVVASATASCPYPASCYYPAESLTPDETDKDSKDNKVKDDHNMPIIVEPEVAGQSSTTKGQHTNIKTTVFWAGEQPSADNNYISNVPSAWYTNWVGHFGGVDTPDKRSSSNPYHPAGFTPKENPFYFALPFGDYTPLGIKTDLPSIVPWVDKTPKFGQSVLKNRWIRIEFGGKAAYAQWADVGPTYHDDADYVFGTAQPRYAPTGLDVSPAVAIHLGLEGNKEVSQGGGVTNWQFVEANNVPDGPWKQIVTTSPPDWN